MTVFTGISLLAFSLLIAESASLPSLSSFSAPTSKQFVGEGGVVILDCHYQGELSMRISGSLVWNFSPSDGSPADNILTAYHPDRQPEPTVEGKEFIGKLNLAPSEDHGYGAIKITDFQERMQGRFICRVYESGSGWIDKAAHDLQTAYLETPQLHGGDSPIVVKEGDEISIKCSVEAAPRPEFTWLVNGNRVTPEDDQSEAGKGGGVQAEEDKKKIHESVFKLTPNRESQGAEIKCMANGPGVWTVPSRRSQWPNGRVVVAPLEVNYPPYPPYITLEDSQWFYEGTVLALGCTVADRGYPPASIRMKFPDGKEAFTSTDTIVHRSFRLKPNYHDNSVICTAETQLDDLREETKKVLKVAFGPETVDIEGNVNVDAGQSTTLTCSASAVNPEAEIHWSGAKAVSRVVNVTKLVVTPTWRQNGEKITCRGNNPYYAGKDKDRTDSVILNVRHRPMWVGSESFKMVVKPIGEEALLTCSVIANPVEDLTFQWRFDGHLLKEETTREIKVRANDSTLGVYTCSATNGVGNSSFILNLLDSEAAAKEAAAFQLVVIVAVVVATFILIILFLVACKLYQKYKWKRVEAAFLRRPKKAGKSSPNHDTPPNDAASRRYIDPNDAAAAALFNADVDSTSTPISAKGVSRQGSQRDGDNSDEDAGDNDENWNVQKKPKAVRSFHRSTNDELIALSWQSEDDMLGKKPASIRGVP